ncbi:MAG: hypothetical protein ABIS01_05930, partial [Ferruginibacter sp.]
KNILNNNIAIKAVYDQVGFVGVMFEGKFRFTKQQVAQDFEVDIRTVERLPEEHSLELENSGYEVFSGFRLKKLKDQFDATDINVGHISQIFDNEIIASRASNAGIFTYKAFLNIGMLLSNSDKAKALRSAILDIVIDVLNKKLGGSTKYINQREEDFLPSALREHNYRKAFTNALDEYITENKFKYGQLTDKIYKSIFRENAKEYRQVLKLTTKERVRGTMYSEVLDLIASYENGFSDYLKRNFEKNKTKLSLSQGHLVFNEYEALTEAIYDPLREKARVLMASRDMAFREALHEKLKEYVNEVSAADFEKFLGERSQSLNELLEENKEVFKRLKDR